MEFAFELKGITAVLMHADDVEAADELDRWRKDPKKKSLSVPGDDRSPPWTWQTYLYHDGENLCLPADNMMVALRTAAAKMPHKRGSTFKALSQSCLLIGSEYLEFRNDGELVPIRPIVAIRDEPFSAQSRWVQEHGFKLHVKRAKIGQSKHVRVRARFDHWTCSGAIETLDPAITAEILGQMFDLAGRYAGLFDWRVSSPKSPGNWGMFDATVRAVASARRKGA